MRYIFKCHDHLGSSAEDIKQLMKHLNVSVIENENDLNTLAIETDGTSLSVRYVAGSSVPSLILSENSEETELVYYGVFSDNNHVFLTPKAKKRIPKQPLEDQLTPTMLGDDSRDESEVSKKDETDLTWRYNARILPEEENPIEPKERQQWNDAMNAAVNTYYQLRLANGSNGSTLFGGHNRDTKLIAAEKLAAKEDLTATEIAALNKKTAGSILKAKVTDTAANVTTGRLAYALSKLGYTANQNGSAMGPVAYNAADTTRTVLLRR